MASKRFLGSLVPSFNLNAPVSFPEPLRGILIMVEHPAFYRLGDEKPIIRTLNSKQFREEVEKKGHTKGWDFNLFHLQDIKHGVNGLEFTIEFLYTPKANYPF